jgi:aminopeptidase N
MSLDVGAIGTRDEDVPIEVRALQIERVSLDGVAGPRPLAFALVDDEQPKGARMRRRLDVGIPADAATEPTLVIEYRFREQDERDDGAHKGAFDGRTYTWPWFCGNLFPCRSDFANGSTFSLDVRGPSASKDGGPIPIAYPPRIELPVPSYVPAYSVGPYAYLSLGKTKLGTEVGVFHFPGQAARAKEGTRALLAGFDWLEHNVGPYALGSKAAVVMVRASDGLEHHPYWHIGEERWDEVGTHVHEAAHGWFSVGVRLRCYEDFVLSEGTVDYLAARALEAIGDAEAKTIWSDYGSELAGAMKTAEELRAWPGGGATCGDWSPERNFNAIPYVKGALFYRAVSKKIGEDALLQVIARFYRDHQGKAASMREMIDAIAASGKPIDVEACAHAWLTEKALPPGDPLTQSCP